MGHPWVEPFVLLCSFVSAGLLAAEYDGMPDHLQVRRSNRLQSSGMARLLPISP